jgi:hypothetical protein
MVYTWVPLWLGPVPNFGAGGYTSCLYPNSFFAPNTSPDAAQHPTGCDLVSTSDPEDAALHAVDLVQHTPSRGGPWEYWGNYDVRGDSYAGFIVDVASVPEGARWEAFGVWVTGLGFEG